jgi:hypothetical protein
MESTTAAPRGEARPQVAFRATKLVPLNLVNQYIDEYFAACDAEVAANKTLYELKNGLNAVLRPYLGPLVALRTPSATYYGILTMVHFGQVCMTSFTGHNLHHAPIPFGTRFERVIELDIDTKEASTEKLPDVDAALVKYDGAIQAAMRAPNTRATAKLALQTALRGADLRFVQVTKVTDSDEKPFTIHGEVLEVRFHDGKQEFQLQVNDYNSTWTRWVTLTAASRISQVKGVTAVQG